MRLALIRNSIVKSVVDATEEESQAYATEYEATVDVSAIVPEPQVGWLLVGNKLITNGTNGPIRLTRLGFRQRFTFTELCAIETASYTDVQVAVLKENLAVSMYVDITRPDTIAGMGLLAYKGLITSERMTLILTAPPTETELYHG